MNNEKTPKENTIEKSTNDITEKVKSVIIDNIKSTSDTVKKNIEKLFSDTEFVNSLKSEIKSGLGNFLKSKTGKWTIFSIILTAGIAGIVLLILGACHVI